MKPSLIKKLCAGAATFLVVITMVYAPLAPNQTPKAHAIFGVGDIVFDPANFGTNLTQTTIMQVLNGLAWTVAKTTIASITRSTVNWINSGFNGSPAFVTDLQANLNALSDTVANNFFAQLNKATVTTTGFNLVSPFQDQITQQLRNDYYRSTGSLLGLNAYNLNQQSSNPQAFLNGTFSQGGLNAFFSANQNPANNPFGTYLAASNALWNQIDAASKQRQSEVTAGRGFLSSRSNCNATAKTTSTSLAKTDTTVGCPIQTPGSVIESQLENQLGSGVRQLELADSINEIVGALMSQLVNQVLGTNGLAGLSQPSSGGGSSYINQATTPADNSNVTSSLTDGLFQTIANDLVTLATFRDDWQKILDAANAAQKACVNNADIASVVTQATAGVAKGNTAIQQETAIQAALQTAATSTAADAGTQLTLAITQYQSFLSASTTPSYTDEQYASDQSTDTSGSSTTTPSLYTQMVTERNTCGPVTLPAQNAL